VDTQTGTSNKCFKAGIWGSIIVAICCFTPILVIGLGIVGLAALTSYLDAVLLPMLGFFVLLLLYGWWTRRQEHGRS